MVAINIQRGRDHGIPKYNDLRRGYGLAPASSFSDITDNMLVQRMLSAAYTGDVNEIDAWIGGLAETHVDGGMVGELFATIIADQFRRSMLGDQFFFRGDDDLKDTTLTRHVIDISTITLADILAANTNVNMDGSENAFLVER